MGSSEATDESSNFEDELLSPDPLEEARQRVTSILSHHPLRIIVVILFVIGTFIAGAAASGVIEDLIAAWFREKAAPFLRQGSITNGWLFLLVVTGSIFLAISLATAVRNYRRSRELNASLAVAEKRVLDLQGVLDNQKRLLDHFGRDRILQEERFEQLAAVMRQRVERELGVLSILDEALLLMVRSMRDGLEAPSKARERFFGVYKRAIPRLFLHPEDIRNVCLIEPNEDCLCFSSHCTIPLPAELTQVARYYIGNDDARRHESGLEGRIYVQIDEDNSNLADIDPVIVQVWDRLKDRAPDSDGYIGFYGRVGLAVPFASYIVVPISRQLGVLRVESLTSVSFGPSQFAILKQLAAKVDLAFVITSALAAE